MIDISHKSTTLRYARASGKIFLTPETVSKVREKKVPKGDVAEVARAAGIQAAKRAPDIMVFSHTLPLDWAEISMELLEDGLKFTAEARTVWKTGLEMEVMAGVTAALLNAYDMLKPLQDDIRIGDIHLEEKRGGKSDYSDQFENPLQAVILTVSSAKKEGRRENRSATLIREFLKGRQINIAEEMILDEDAGILEDELLKRSDNENIDLVVITGASGPQKNDIAPDVVKKLSDRLLPGLSEAMHQYGYQRTPYAMLSSQAAGLRKSTLILSLPGSSRGAEESLNAIFPGVLHLFRMIGR